MPTDYRRMFGATGPTGAPGVPDEEPSLFSRGLGAVQSILGAPKAGLDYLARRSAETLFDIPDTGASPGQMLRAGLGLDPSESDSYSGRLAGKGIEFFGDLGTDPTLPLSFGSGTAGKVATAGLAGVIGAGALQEGARALETIQDEGFTPQAAEEGLGALLGGAGAGLAAGHLARGARASRLARDSAAAELAAAEAAQPKPFATTGTEFPIGQAPSVGTGYGRLDFDFAPEMGVLPAMVPERAAAPAVPRSASFFEPTPGLFSFDQPMGQIQAAVPEAPTAPAQPRPGIKAQDSAELGRIAEKIQAEDFGTLRKRLRTYERSLYLDSADAVRQELARRSTPAQVAPEATLPATEPQAAEIVPPEPVAESLPERVKPIPQGEDAIALSLEDEAASGIERNRAALERAAKFKVENMPPDAGRLVHGVADRALTDPSAAELMGERLGMTPDQIAKGAEDIKMDGQREFSPEATAIKKATLKAIQDSHPDSTQPVLDGAAAPGPDQVGAITQELDATTNPSSQVFRQNSLTPEAATADPTVNPDLTQPVFNPDLTQPIPSVPQDVTVLGGKMPEPGNVKLPTIYTKGERPAGLSADSAALVPDQVAALKEAGASDFPLIPEAARKQIFDGDAALKSIRARGRSKASDLGSAAGEGAGALKDLATYGASLIEKGIRNFPEWSREMAGKLGDAFEGLGTRLREIYAQAVAMAKSAGAWMDDRYGDRERGALGSFKAKPIPDQAPKVEVPPSAAQAATPPPSAKAAATPESLPPATKTDKGLEIWKAGLVSAPGTQIANILGNVGEQLVRVGETAVGSLVDRAIGGPKTRIAREASFELGGAMRGASRSLGKLVSDLKDIALLKPEKTPESTPADFRAGAIGGKVGRAVRTPFRLLGAFDQFFQEVGGSAELHKLAMRKAGGDAVKAAAIMEHPPADMLEAVAASKKSRTFQDPHKIADAIVKFRKEHPWFNAVAPFAQTPANIMTRTLERSPIGFRQGFKALAAYKKALKLNAAPEVLERLKSEAIDKLSRPLVGTMILGTFATVAKAGGMTGGGPSDPKAKALLKDTGWQPYSFVLPGKVYLPFNKFQPVSSLLGFAADMVEATNAKDANDLFEKGIGSVTEGFISQSYLQGVADAAAFINDPKQFAGQYVSGLAGSVVPNIVSKANQALDSSVRDTRPEESGLKGLPERVGKTVMSRIPGLAQMLPERRSGTGEVIERPGNALTRALSPIQPSVQKAGKDLEALMADIGAVPAAPSKEVKANGRQIRWTDEEYEALQKSDLRATEALRKEIKSPRFRRMSAEDQKHYLDTERQKYRRAAKQKIMGTPAFRRRALA